MIKVLIQIGGNGGRSKGEKVSHRKENAQKIDLSPKIGRERGCNKKEEDDVILIQERRGKKRRGGGKKTPFFCITKAPADLGEERKEMRRGN